MSEETELKTYRVWYTYTDEDYVDVEAEDEEAAAEKAFQETCNDDFEATDVYEL